MPATISLIIPTIGRPSLLRTLDSVIPQLAHGDEIIVIGDGPQPGARVIIEQAHLRYDLNNCPMCGGDVVLHYLETAPSRTWGHAQRQFGMSVATGDYIAFLDDDDTWTLVARAMIALVTNTDDFTRQKCPHIFQMRYANGSVLWQTPQLLCGNVGTPMFVVPNEPENLGTWSSRYEGDFDFASSWKWPESLIAWHGEVLALIDHGEQPK